MQMAMHSHCKATKATADDDRASRRGSSVSCKDRLQHFEHQGDVHQAEQTIKKNKFHHNNRLLATLSSIGPLPKFTRHRCTGTQQLPPPHDLCVCKACILHYLQSLLPVCVQLNQMECAKAGSCHRQMLMLRTGCSSKHPVQSPCLCPSNHHQAQGLTTAASAFAAVGNFTKT